MDGKALINATNGSVLNFNDDLIINGTESGISVTDSVVNVFNGGITNNGSINIAGSKLTAASVSGTGSFTIGAGASELNIGSLQQNVYANQNSDEAILLTGSVNTSKAIRVYGMPLWTI